VPIEIRELVIRAVVADGRGADGRGADGRGADLDAEVAAEAQRALVDATVAAVLATLRRQRER
jgi:hypothetical protein